MARRVLLFLIVTTSLLTGCGPGRMPIAPGEIPRGEYVTSEDEQYGQQVLSVLTRTYPLSRDDDAINRVRDIVNKLADAAGAGDAPWNVYVLRGDSVANAAATRGNFVFVWTGMLRTVQNDEELAAVLAHEIGHVLANHTQPTPSEEASEIMANIGGNVASQVVAVQGPYGALSGIAGVLAQEAIKAFIVNPESQRKEFEADQIGLFLMADAGYDPQNAVSLWTTMSQQSSMGDIPSFLSSHPPNQERIEELRQLLPSATERYQVAKNLGPRPPKARPPQFEADTFVIDHEPASAKRSFTDKAPARSPTPTDQLSNPIEWRAREDGVTIFSSPNTRSEKVDSLSKNDPLTVGFLTSGWYEVITPTKGYVLQAEIYRPRR
jgi:Zn-dependent protease with chaperone function